MGAGACSSCHEKDVSNKDEREAVPHFELGDGKLTLHSEVRADEAPSVVVYLPDKVLVEPLPLALRISTDASRRSVAESSPRDSEVMWTPRELAARTDSAEQTDDTFKANESDDSASSVSSAGSRNSFRGKKRRQARRLLMTHTMGLQPSSALQLIIESAESVHTHYTLDKSILGQGAFGVVRKGRLKATGAVRAVKAITKKKMGTEQVVIRQEIEIMKSLDHPNLIMLFEVMEDSKELFLVLEFAGGGSLQGLLKVTKCFGENDAAYAIQQILRGTLYLHKHGIVHRDLKADNCLVDRPGPLSGATLKVADFGLSCKLEAGKVLTRSAGTPTHMAPEVFAKRYTHIADVWSCGIICFVMLAGYVPFTGHTKEELTANVQKADIDLGRHELMNLSQKAVNFLLKMLHKSPNKRATAASALQDQWVTMHQGDAQKIALPRKVIEDMKKYRRRNRFKQAALHVIASMLPEEDIREQRKAFIHLDKDGDGFFTIEELRDAIEGDVFASAKNKREDAKDAKQLAEDEAMLKMGGFTYTEFLAATFDMQKVLSMGLCHAAFASFDKNQDGHISISELATGKMLGQLTMSEVIETMEALDVDGDCELDYNEFMQIMRSEVPDLGDAR